MLSSRLQPPSINTTSTIEPFSLVCTDLDVYKSCILRCTIYRSGANAQPAVYSMLHSLQICPLQQSYILSNPYLHMRVPHTDGRLFAQVGYHADVDRAIELSERCNITTDAGVEAGERYPGITIKGCTKESG